MCIYVIRKTWEKNRDKNPKRDPFPFDKRTIEKAKEKIVDDLTRNVWRVHLFFLLSSRSYIFVSKWLDF
jgi:hypothetical protein